jgi:hypothetical protein
MASLLLLSLAARAHAGTVALVQPSCATRDTTETLSRIHGELLAVGLHVAQVSPLKSSGAAQSDLRKWVAQLAQGGDIDAVIDLVCDAESVAINVWTIERNPSRIELSRVIGEPNTADTPERLAIRTIELLRSSFLASGISGARQVPQSNASSKTPTTPRIVPVEPVVPRNRFGIEAGATVLVGTDGIGPALMPVVAVDWMPRSWLSVRGEAAGFGSHPTVTSGAGSAKVAQHYGILGVGLQFHTDRSIVPFASLAAGTLRTSVQGEAEPPRQERNASQWSLLLDGSLGARLRLSHRYYVTLAAHVQFAEPYVALRLLEARVATSGRPNLGLTATVGAWL